MHKILLAHGKQHHEFFELYSSFGALRGILEQHLVKEVQIFIFLTKLFVFLMTSFGGKKKEILLFAKIEEYHESKKHGKFENAEQIHHLKKLREDIMNCREEMEKEHEEVEKMFEKIKIITKNFEIPSDACETLKLTWQKLQNLNKEIEANEHVEEEFLFKRIE